MVFDWKNAFSQASFFRQKENTKSLDISSLAELKYFLDFVQAKYCLIKPFTENQGYPTPETKDLLPSFEGDPWEFKDLPGFSMVAFNRPLSSFNEIFQYDILSQPKKAEENPEHHNTKNLQSILNRLPKKFHDSFRKKFIGTNISKLDNYPQLIESLAMLDRAHVLARDDFNRFHLAGIYASFPSDLDGEIKRYGLRTGKFKLDDNELYENNRFFIYQFLMELYGFPMASERRTSAALFARRLHKIDERFIVRALGQSDRIITTIWNNENNRHYPRVEKLALVKLEAEQKEIIAILEAGGYFVDRKQRVILARISYKQHRYNAENVRQDRALSVEKQEIIHPLTGHVLQELNFVRNTTTMLVRLNDIVRGEYIGRVIYKRSEIVENTDTEEKRLKFLFSWLSKNQRRIIGYSDDFYNNVTKVLDDYLHGNKDRFDSYHELYSEILIKYAYIRQARTVRYLEDIVLRNYKGEHLSYSRMLLEAVNLLRDLKFELGNYFEPLVVSSLHNIEKILNNKYILRKYIQVSVPKPSPICIEIRKNYGKLVSLHDEFLAMRKLRHVEKN